MGEIVSHALGRSLQLKRLDSLVTRQFYDLIEIFRIGGYSPHTNYLFLGRCGNGVSPAIYRSD